MKKNRSLMLALLLALGASGCLASWFETLRRDPIAGIAEGVGFLQNALGLADVAFNGWAAANPDTAGASRQQFNSLVGNVRRGLNVAQSGVRTAAVAHAPAPNVNELLGSAREGMQNVSAFLQGLSGGPGRAASPDLQAAITATAAASRPLELR